MRKRVHEKHMRKRVPENCIFHLTEREGEGERGREGGEGGRGRERGTGGGERERELEMERQ